MTLVCVEEASRDENCAGMLRKWHVPEVPRETVYGYVEGKEPLIF